MFPNVQVSSERPARIPLFGYFCIERDGLETILVRVESDNRWAFPINTEFDPCVQTAAQAIDAAVVDFCKRSGLLGRAELLASGLEPPIIHNVDIGRSPTVAYEVSEEIKPGIFFKIKLNDLGSHSAPGHTWETKSALFAMREQCANAIQLYAIMVDFTYERFGFKILECVDMLVFRVRDDHVEFLMLKREDRRLGIVGWEYPKGGILYHETLREGALRELEEETGVTSHVYRGYLGYQAVDVSDRKLIGYDTLRVHGLTFLFTGAEDTIRPSAPGEDLRTPIWVPWEEAREMVWMKNYGPEFFDRWRAKEAQILDGLL